MTVLRLSSHPISMASRPTAHVVRLEMSPWSNYHAGSHARTNAGPDGDRDQPEGPMSQADEPGPGSVHTPRADSIWIAFSFPSYRRFWTAALVRVFGLQFHMFAIGFLVVETLDRSPIWLGTVGLAQAVPTILLSVPAGWMADRYEHRHLLLVSQVLMALGYVALAWVIVAGLVDIWMVIGWAVVIGSLSAIGNPAQQAILPRLIEMRAIASAVAAMSAIWNGTRIIGPGAAGLLIAAIGVGEAFLVAAAAFAVSIVLIALLRLTPMPPPHADADRSLLAGLRYVGGNRIFLTIVGLSFFSAMFGMSYQYLMPIFALRILDVGATGFGALGAAGGAGALVGTAAAVKAAAMPRRGELMIGSAALFGALVAAFSISTHFALSLVAVFCAGLTASVYLNLGMMTLQVLVPDELRGRVMGVWSMTWFLTPVGAFFVGAGAEIVGTQAMVAIGGLSVTAFAMVLYAISPQLRRIPTPEHR
jgi:MFS family permease